VLVLGNARYKICSLTRLLNYLTQSLPTPIFPDKTPAMTDALDPRRKRLIYRSNYRGFKEMDILLGGFVRDHVAGMSDQELDQLEHLMDAKDHDIYAWITQNQDLPAQYDTALFLRLKAYTPDL